MHVLGILFLVLMIGHLFAFVDSIGAWVFDRRETDEETTDAATESN